MPGLPPGGGPHHDDDQGGGEDADHEDHQPQHTASTRPVVNTDQRGVVRVNDVVRDQVVRGSHQLSNIRSSQRSSARV